jgi:neutral ceramidase
MLRSRRSMKKGDLLVALAAFFSGAALVLACVPVDRRPPFARPSYRADFDAVQRAASRAPLGRGAYRAGWSRVAIDVPPGVPLAGFGEREGAPSTGVRDPAYVRAFAIEAGDHRVVLVTADLLELDQPASDEVRARVRATIDPSMVFFTASHTHSGPGGYASGMIWQLVTGPYDRDAFEAVVDAHVKAVLAAIEDLAPAAIGSASEPVPGLIKNRTEKSGPVDDRLFVLRFEKENGKSAAFWAYGCHAVLLLPKNTKVSADYPGEIAAAIEGRTLDVLGFAAGGVGSSNPRKDSDDTAWFVRPLLAGLQRALVTAKENSKRVGALSSAQLDRPLPPLNYRVSDEVGIWDGAVEPLIGAHRVRYGTISIGDTVLLHLPSETSGNLTRIARGRAKRSGIELAVLPFNGTYLGYVTPRRIYDLPEELGDEMLFYETHTMTFLGAWGGDLMMNLGLRLASGVRARAMKPDPPGFY